MKRLCWLLGHRWVPEWVPAWDGILGEGDLKPCALFFAQGFTEYHCSRCGYLTRLEAVAGLIHSVHCVLGCLSEPRSLPSPTQTTRSSRSP